MSTRSGATFLFATIILFIQTAAHAAPDSTSQSASTDGGRWRQSAKAHKLTDADVAVLERNKFVISGQTYPQAFLAYREPDMPVFITSDSIINAYHVLLEESLYRLESARARELADILQLIWTNLPGPSPKESPGQAAAVRRARIVIGVALSLMGQPASQPDDKLAAIIAGEVEQVTAAKAKALPAWLGKPDESLLAIDYTRCRPRGFYTTTNALRRYFRAVSWLQAIPFRVGGNEECMAFLLIAECLSTDRVGNRDVLAKVNRFFTGFTELLGRPDDWDLVSVRNEIDRKRSSIYPRIDWPLADLMTSVREAVAERARAGEGSQISDMVRLTAQDVPNFRVLSAHRTPDAILFALTTFPWATDQPRFPGGLEVCAALGSKFAREKLAGEKGGKVVAIIDKAKPIFAGRSVYCDYLDAMAALLGKPEPDAPPFMATPAWEAKSCQTALAGWAQLRHAWILQAKQSIPPECEDGINQPGFVEPAPEFFSRFGRVIRRTERLLRDGGALDADGKGAADELRETATILRNRGFAEKGAKAAADCTPDEIALLDRFGIWGSDRQDYHKDKIKQLEEQAEELESGKTRKVDGRVIEGWEAMFARRFQDLAERWQTLGELCQRLETIAHKQLRGVALTEDENGFIRGVYEASLTHIYFYAGLDYPRDDAMRVADVYTRTAEMRTLHVAVGRPRAIYVLYPTKSGEVLCRGSVMPYYEFVHGSRLTDAEWEKLHDSRDRPPPPEWVKPILGGPPATRPGAASP